MCKKIIVIICVTLLCLPFLFSAQTADSASDSSLNLEGLSPEQQSQLKTFLQARIECLSGYHFGSVTIKFNETYNGDPYSAGKTITISGTAENKNDYPLTDGAVVIRISRQDASVADKEWHPEVFEQRLPDKFTLAARGSQDFSYTWNIPAMSPSGDYRAELYFLAGTRYIMAGMPYVSNAPGAVTVFSIYNSSEDSAYLNFNRSSVRINGQQVDLRAVPPILNPDESAEVAVMLEARSQNPISATIHAAAYSWSETDNNPPLFENEDHQTIIPGKTLNLKLPLKSLASGVYEVVVTATPDDPSILPSMISVRFPVAGQTPRIIYSGIGEISNGEAKIITCVVNGTFGREGEKDGEITTTVQVDGKDIESVSKNVTSDYLATTSVNVPLSSVNRNLVVVTEARDANGNITDSNKTDYPVGLLKDIPATKGSWFLNIVIVLIILIAVLIAVIIFIIVLKRYKNKNNFSNSQKL